MKHPRIALIHATPLAIDPIVAAFGRLWPEARTTNLLDDSLSADLAAEGRLTGQMIERFITLARYVHGSGADAILLIVACLSRSQLTDLQGFAWDLGLDVLVEVHDADEAATAIRADANLIGVNNRNLKDFTISLQTTYDLLHGIMGNNRVIVSESGISTRADCQRLEAAGVDAVLVGEALITDPDPAARLAALRGKLVTRI